MNSEEMEQTERDVFYEMAAEREIKLSVHPWRMLLQEEIDVPQERRRVNSRMGSASSFSCFGGNGGGGLDHLGAGLVAHLPGLPCLPRAFPHWHSSVKGN